MPQYYDKKEVDEAITAANNTLYYLEQAQSCLKDAAGYGIWDMLGGGLFSTMLKHNKMDHAEQSLKDAKKAVRQLGKELNDIGKIEELKIDVSDFLSFADYFFDGIVADWMVQSKINKARDQVEDAIRQVTELKQKLSELCTE